MERVEDNGGAQNTGTGMAYFYQVRNVIENITLYYCCCRTFLNN